MTHAVKILIVEDNDLNLKLVRTLLRPSGYHLLEATDAETGIGLARSHLPDLILMDIQLPGMDGLTATRTIKNDPTLRDIRVVALTSFAMAGDKEKALVAGCDGYITKPIDTRSFMGTIQKQLGIIQRHRVVETDPERSELQK